MHRSSLASSCSMASIRTARALRRAKRPSSALVKLSSANACVPFTHRCWNLSRSGVASAREHTFAKSSEHTSKRRRTHPHHSSFSQNISVDAQKRRRYCGPEHQEMPEDAFHFLEYPSLSHATQQGNPPSVGPSRASLAAVRERATALAWTLPPQLPSRPAPEGEALPAPLKPTRRQSARSFSLAPPPSRRTDHASRCPAG